MSIFLLTDEIIFPDVEQSEEDGLLAAGGDLSPERILAGYSQGIFPWYSDGDPILWWSPDPRLVLFPEKLKVSHSLKQKINRSQFEVRFDTNFSSVMSGCSDIKRNDQDGTWITGEMKQAYCRLHEMGYAHSVETYFHGELAGGLYGVSLGSVFFGESMFHHLDDASKVALYSLVEKIKGFGFTMIDSQVETSHLIRMGAELISRRRYLELLSQGLLAPTRRGPWDNQ